MCTLAVSKLYSPKALGEWRGKQVRTKCTRKKKIRPRPLAPPIKRWCLRTKCTTTPMCTKCKRPSISAHLKITVRIWNKHVVIDCYTNPRYLKSLYHRFSSTMTNPRTHTRMKWVFESWNWSAMSAWMHNAHVLHAKSLTTPTDFQNWGMGQMLPPCLYMPESHHWLLATSFHTQVMCYKQSP